MFAGPTPPELTADTLMTYMVKTVRLESVELFRVQFTVTKRLSLLESTG